MIVLGILFFILLVTEIIIITSFVNDPTENKYEGIGGPYVCTVNSLYSRQQPNIRSKIMSKYDKGMIVNIDNWYINNDGFIWGRYYDIMRKRNCYIIIGSSDALHTSGDYLIRL